MAVAGLIEGEDGGWSDPFRCLRHAEARIKGDVGEACPERGGFTMVRNGARLKCETCGGTTGAVEETSVKRRL